MVHRPREGEEVGGVIRTGEAPQSALRTVSQTTLRDSPGEDEPAAAVPATAGTNERHLTIAEDTRAAATG